MSNARDLLSRTFNVIKCGEVGQRLDPLTELSSAHIADEELFDSRDNNDWATETQRLFKVSRHLTTSLLRPLDAAGCAPWLVDSRPSERRP
jgi:hypothetical protein